MIHLLLDVYLLTIIYVETLLQRPLLVLEVVFLVLDIGWLVSVWIRPLLCFVNRIDSLEPLVHFSANLLLLFLQNGINNNFLIIFIIIIIIIIRIFIIIIIRIIIMIIIIIFV